MQNANDKRRASEAPYLNAFIAAGWAAIYAATFGGAIAAATQHLRPSTSTAWTWSIAAISAAIGFARNYPAKQAIEPRNSDDINATSEAAIHTWEDRVTARAGSRCRST